MPDNYAHCRPLIGLADSTGPSTPFSTANFISLKSGELVRCLHNKILTKCFEINCCFFSKAHCIKFNNEIVDLAVNRHVVVVTLREKLAVFDACNFTAKYELYFHFVVR